MTSSNKIRIGLIGCGLASSWHLDYLRTDERVEVVALADVNESNIKNALDRIPDTQRESVKTFSRYEEMLEESDLDAAVILTPHKFHFDQVKAALEHGLHVLIEKPLTVLPEQSKELVRLAAGAGRILMVAYQYPLTGAAKYVRDAVRSGSLGEITYFNAMLGLYWHKLASGWRLDPEISEGGVLVDSGSHLVDLVLYLTDAGVEEVFAYADYDGERVDVYSSALVKFDHGRTGVLSAVGGGPFLVDLTIVGTKGAVTMRDLDTVTHVDENRFIGEIGTYHGYNKYDPSKAPETTLPAEEFVNAVSSNDLSASNGERAVRVGLFTEAVYRSIGTGKPVNLKRG